MKNKFLMLLMACVFLFPAKAFGYDESVVDGIAAVVNGQIITLYDLNRRMKPILERFKDQGLDDNEKKRLDAMRKQVLEQMISEMLIEAEAQNLKLTISDVELENEIRRFKDKNGLTEKQFDRELAKQGLTRREFGEKMRKDIMKHRVIAIKVRRKIVVGEDEIRKAYDDSMGDSISQDSKVDLGLILMPEGVSSDQVREKIQKGEMTFAQAADKYSQGPGAGQGGDLGALRWNDLAPEWQNALDGLNPGEVSEAFEVGGREALLVINEVEKGNKISYEEAREDIYNKLYNKKMDKVFQDYLNKLKSKALIERKL